ncbi:hypothetical protein CTKZ_05700 [Cellulomonas algicola]|uniref:Uncharacterized protein n=2 Tax=Cellulomonas algicola TaxID=2071633 RepID=A0A401UWH5_9CELL|nr:hypothetical protein CTKZ_05700 [Cellulomonas algicola]
MPSHEERDSSPARRAAPRPTPARAHPDPQATAVDVTGPPTSRAHVLALQRAVGNRHVADLMSGRTVQRAGTLDEPVVDAVEQRLAEAVSAQRSGDSTGAPRSGPPAPRAGTSAGAGRPPVVQRMRTLLGALHTALFGRAGNVVRPGLFGRARGPGPAVNPGLVGRFLQLLVRRVRQVHQQARPAPAQAPAALAVPVAPVPGAFAAPMVSAAIVAAAMRWPTLRRIATSLGLDPAAVAPTVASALPPGPTGPSATVPSATGPGTTGPSTTGPVGTQATGPAPVGPVGQPGPGGPGGPPARTDTLVPGLYQSIDPKAGLPGWTFTDIPDDRPDEVSIETLVRAPGGQAGRMVRTYQKGTRTLVLAEAFLHRIPKQDRWLPISPPMTARGTPLETYLTIRAMKILEATYGASFYGRSRPVHISTIINERSMAHIGAAAKKGVPLDEAARTCHSVQYATNAIVQSGGTIESVTFSIGTGRWVEARHIKDQQLLADYQLAPGDKVPYWFDIDIEVKGATTT